MSHSESAQDAKSAATLAVAEQQVTSFLADLETLVNIDSGTYTPAGVTRIADELAPRFAALGFAVKTQPGRELGPQLVARRQGTGRAKLVIVGHMDTVFPDGEAQRRPYALRDGRAYGPGVFDMKSGLLVGLYALQVLAEMDEAPYSELTFICNSDEEIGSPESHDLIAATARDADVVLVLEPTSDVERVTVARKGVGLYRLEVRGRAAHAGVEPKRGRSAIIELAHRTLALHALNGTIPGVTVNVGVVAGGERPNIVADHATAEIDVRAADPAGVAAIHEALQRVASDIERHVPDTEVSLTGGMRHQPFTQSEQSARVFALAQAEAATQGLTLRGEPTGGASDGNTAAALGVATLDGLGPAGGLAHNPGEFITVASVAPRIALLAGLLRRLDVGE
ncbi:MAG TPA: M20 family metallopeptidase [Ktedonobacterales bacterium]|nr:M20 family metallopeptidase [Ktedonobacterales bacterium]